MVSACLKFTTTNHITGIGAELAVQYAGKGISKCASNLLLNLFTCYLRLALVARKIEKLQAILQRCKQLENDIGKSFFNLASVNFRLEIITIPVDVTKQDDCKYFFYSFVQPN